MPYVDGRAAMHAMPGEFTMAEISNQPLSIIHAQRVIKLESWFTTEFADPVIYHARKTIPAEPGKLFCYVYNL